MRRALLRGPRCLACRHGILQAFAAIAGVPIEPPITSTFRWAPRNQHLRKFSSIVPCRSKQSPKPVNVTKEEEEQPSKDGIRQQTRTSGQSKVEPLPWYLQVETPRMPSHPLAERQQIPHLPNNPPPILQDLLQHISVDIGLDDLSLLDLRGLNPPPALGANLLMIIGTARSVKHLNVSADRLCRWLRSTHKLRPYADGLLGRNELKLKLRRKARRAKLARSVGSTVGGSPDDGITTGWVCINVGSVESGEASRTEETQNEGFIGFGKRSGGAKIVIQMLTEEKRSELDLESLWGGMLDRKFRKDPKESEKETTEHLAHEVGQAQPSKKDWVSGLSLGTARRPRPGGDQASQTVRGFHTSRTSRRMEQRSEGNIEYEGLDPLSVEPMIKHEGAESTFGQDARSQSLSEGESAIEPNKESRNENKQAEAPSPGNRGERDGRMRRRALRNIIKNATLPSLIHHLETLPRDQALQELGIGPKDYDSTSFLKLFYRDFSSPPDEMSNEYQISLICYAIEIGHPHYHKADLMDTFKSMAGSGHDLSIAVFQNVLRALLVRQDTKPGIEINSVSNDSMNMALEVLENMSLRGVNVFTEGTFLVLHEAINIQAAGLERTEEGEVASKDVQEGSAQTDNVSLARKRLNQVMEACGVSFTTNDSYEKMLRLYANEDNADLFWELWQKIALQLQARSKEMYALMFRYQAKRGHQADSRSALSEWIPMMERELPPVHLQGDVARSVMECMLVADPEIETKSLRGTKGTLPQLWEQCKSALGDFRSNEPENSQPLQNSWDSFER